MAEDFSVPWAPGVRVLYGQAALATRVAELGSRITADYAGRALTVLCVLKGASLFTAVLVVEDIVDTGLTLRFLLQALVARGCRSVRTCALLDKPSRRVEAVTVDYTGFVVEDRFLVGYGLDHDERWRNLPFVGVLERPP